MVSTEATATWIGWFRSKNSRAWQQLASGNTQGEAMSGLLRTVTGSGDLLALPVGQHPDSRPGPARGQQRPRPVLQRGIKERTTPLAQTPLPAGWMRSKRGNAWRKLPSGETVTVFRRGSRFFFSIADAYGPRYSDCSYATEMEALTALEAQTQALARREPVGAVEAVSRR